MALKKKYKVAGIAVYKDDSYCSFVGYTYAVSEKRAVSNLQYRYGILLRDVHVKEVMPPESKQVSIYDML